MKPRPHSHAGSVLIAVLVICLGLVSITLLFANASFMSYRGADNDLAGREAEQAIEGAARYVLALLAANEVKGSVPELTNATAEGFPLGEATFWIIGRPIDDSANLREPVFGLVDEASKINLNSAPVSLLSPLGISDDLAQQIVDWRSATATSTSDTYGQRQPGYHRKAGPFESVEELALVAADDPSILCGQDANLNGVLDTDENDANVSLTTTISTLQGPGLLEYVTVSSKAAGAGSATPTDASTMQGFINFLRTTDKLDGRGKSIADTLAAAGAPPAGQTIRSALELYFLSGMTAADFDAIVDDLTFPDPGGPQPPVHPINVNTASAAVLRCVPGLGDLAEDIVAARANHSTAIAGITWLKDENVIKDAATAGAVGRYLTGKSYVISADIAAVGRHGRGYRRTRFVFDASGDTPKIIYRRNLAQLGWALGREVRTLLAQERERQ